jgi:cbb3-type cytochrome oxidase maturation protein
MSIILFLILASLALALCALAAFVWAVRTGQFEDTCTPSMRLLMDEPGSVSPSSASPPLLLTPDLKLGLNESIATNHQSPKHHITK